MSLIDLGGMEQRSRIVPNEKNGGNKVKLERLPYIATVDDFEGKDEGKIIFHFVDATGSEYVHKQLDPTTADKENVRRGGFARLLHFFGAMMTAETYENFKKLKVESIADMIEKGTSMMAKDALTIDYTLLLAFKDNKYLGLPAVGDVISSKYKQKTLKLTPLTKMSLVIKESKADSEFEDDGEDDI